MAKTRLMNATSRAARTEPAPALFRLLSDGALSRAALRACGVPIAILDAGEPARPVVYVNAAFEAFFGHHSAEAVGRPLAELVLRGDEALCHRLLAQPGARWNLRAWSRDGSMHHLQLTLGPIRADDGRITHWVAAFHDRSEIEKLRAELESLRALAVT